MLFRSLFAIPVADLKYPHDPNIYCTVAVFVLIPLFWLCKKISVKERVGKTVIAVIMLLSFNINIPNYIWHGFHFPNSLPCRESFLYIFLIVTMAYEAFLHIKEFKVSQIIGAMGGALGAGGLGDIAIRYGYQAYKIPYLVVTSIILIIFVQIIQTIGNHLYKKLS